VTISLFESGDRFGGWIQSKPIRKNDEDFFFECGPRTLRPRGNVGNTTLELLEGIGLESKVLPIKMGHPAAKNRMIYAKGQVCLLPNSPAGIFKTIPPFSKPLFLAGIKDIFTGGTKLEDESIHGFAKRRFGQEVADYAVGSLICGICAGDAREISVNFLLKDLFKIEQKYGGVVRGAILHMLLNKSKTKMEPSNLFQRAKAEKWAIYSMRGGLETIPKALVGKLSGNQNVKLETNTRCQELKFLENGEVRMKINGKDQHFEHLISSIPSYQLAELVKAQHPRLAEELSNIKFVNVGVINLQYNNPNLLGNNTGFGVLVPPIEQLPILGVIFDSCCFDIKNSTVLTAMVGGRWFEDYFGQNPTKEQLLDTVLKNVDKILGIKEKPDLYNINILPKCIPQYVTGHLKRVENIKNYIRDKKLPLSLAGASYDGVGVNDVIFSSKELVQGLELEC
jgi:oxygen-dependent protoporphyrinogen oxidase